MHTVQISCISIPNYFTHLLIQGGDVIILDGGVAARALGSELTEVTILAEGSIFPLMKAIITELKIKKVTL